MRRHGGTWFGSRLALMRRGAAGLYGRHRLPQAANLEANVEAASPTARRPPSGLWLYAVAALMVADLVVGGATRLTESGLSIVEWKPVTGVVPPLSTRARGRRSSASTSHPAVPRAQPRHEPRRVQDHLLVGVVAPAAGAAGRRRIPAAVSVLSLARLDRAAAARAAVDDLRLRRRCSARSAGGWCRPASPAGSACRNIAWRSI